MRPNALLIVGMAAIVATGCLPRTFVTKDPGPHDRGFRYYRPKPYLMVKPLVTAVKKDEPGEVAHGYVSIEMVTLPDYSEEYSIHIRSGLGTNDTSITLEDGWNLTAVNAKLDSQFDENVKAIAELAKVPLGGLESTTVSERSKADPGPMTVPAYDVPLGLYEAVISPDQHGRKRLYGFRYVGFFPYASCPMESCGVTHETCHSAVLYGMVFDASLKAMVFKQLDQIAAHPLEVKRETASKDEQVDIHGHRESNSPQNDGDEDDPHKANGSKAALNRLRRPAPEPLPTP